MSLKIPSHEIQDWQTSIFMAFPVPQRIKYQKPLLKNKYACVNPCPLLFVITTTPACNLSPFFKGGVENRDLLS